MEQLFARIEELVPAYLDFWQDICRIETPSHNKAALDTLADYLQAHAYVPGTSCEVHIQSLRPPMEATAANYALLERYNAFAAELGMAPAKPMVSGGGSDAAYTTQMGIPTLCAVGPCGWDVHTLSERADTTTLAPRAKLAAKAILEL